MYDRWTHDARGERALAAAAKAFNAVIAVLPRALRARVSCRRDRTAEGYSTTWLFDEARIDLMDLNALAGGESPELVFRRAKQRRAEDEHRADVTRAAEREQRRQVAADARLRETQARMRRNHSTPCAF